MENEIRIGCIIVFFYTFLGTQKTALSIIIKINKMLKKKM